MSLTLILPAHSLHAHTDAITCCLQLLQPDAVTSSVSYAF